MGSFKGRFFAFSKAMNTSSVSWVVVTGDAVLVSSLLPRLKSPSSFSILILDKSAFDSTNNAESVCDKSSSVENVTASVAAGAMRSSSGSSGRKRAAFVGSINASRSGGSPVLGNRGAILVSGCFFLLVNLEMKESVDFAPAWFSFQAFLSAALRPFL